MFGGRVASGFAESGAEEFDVVKAEFAGDFADLHLGLIEQFFGAFDAQMGVICFEKSCDQYKRVARSRFSMRTEYISSQTKNRELKKSARKYGYLGARIMKSLLPSLLLTTAALTLPNFASAQTATPGKARQPNIIFVLCDDLGYGDYGVFFQNQRAKDKKPGEPWHSTPNIDKLAAEGVQLPQHYCPAPVCAPSRASLMLGVTQGHANVRNNQFDKALEDNHTVASVLKSAGYATAAFGKWGLQGEKTGEGDWVAHPQKRGFDYFYGYIAHADGHFHYPKENRKPVWDAHTDVSAQLDKCYTSDLFTARAEKWIADLHRKSPDKPFFAYLALDTPHAKLQLPPGPFPREGLQWLGKPGQMINAATGTPDSYTHPDYANAMWDDNKNSATPDVPWPDVMKRYATDVRRIDDCLGDLMGKLKKLGIDDNTLVVFTTDNGPSNESGLKQQKAQPDFFNSFGPFDGIKRDILEGGVRVGALARWPAQIKPGQISQTPSGFWDWMATFADAAKLPVPARSDGVSLMPSLTGKGAQRESDIYIEYRYNHNKTPAYTDFLPRHRNAPRDQMQMLRSGNYVAIRTSIRSQSDDFEIYDIVKDPQEGNDLAKSMPDLERKFKDLALQSRRPNDSATRPYDDELVPSVPNVGRLRGVTLKGYDGVFSYVPDLTAMKANISSTALDIAGADGKSKSWRPQTGAKMIEGTIEAPADGEYTFYLNSQGAAFMRLHRAQLIDADFGYKSGSEVSAKILLKKGKHPFRLMVADRNKSGMKTQLQWSGPNFGKQTIPASAFSRDEN